MAMVKFEGWCLGAADTPSVSGEPGHFFVNTHLLVSARPVTFGELAGYLLWDEVQQTYFVVMSEAEMSMLFQMAQ